MLIWSRADLTYSIKLVKTGTFYIWLEINKEMISTKKNILMCSTYIHPIESPYFNDDSFSILEGRTTISRHRDMFYSVAKCQAWTIT
jgi:hypothetical protein